MHPAFELGKSAAGCFQNFPSAGQENALERVLLPLNGLASWLIVVAGGLSCLHVLGINVAPL